MNTATMKRHTAELQAKYRAHTPPSELRAWLKHESEFYSHDLEAFWQRNLAAYEKSYRPAAPPVLAGDAPERTQYATEREYRRACEQWLAWLYAPLLSRESETERSAREGKLHKHGDAAPVLRDVTPHERDLARIDAEMKLLMDRAATGRLSASEALALHTATGWTPDGRPLHALDVTRAEAALRQLLD